MSAPKHTNANAAIIDTLGHHKDERITIPNNNIRVIGRAYNSTKLSG
jgi:hypothetical protein